MKWVRRESKNGTESWYPLSFSCDKIHPIHCSVVMRRRNGLALRHTQHTSLLPETYISILVCCLSFAWAKRMCLVQFQRCTIFNSLSDVRVVCVPFPCSLPYVMYYSVYAYTSDSFVILVFVLYFQVTEKRSYFSLFFFKNKKNRLMIVLNHIYPFRNGNPQSSYSR